MIPTQVCSKCHEDFMNCKCDSFHPNVSTIKIIDPPQEIQYGYPFTLNELKAIYKLVEHMYIPYENEDAHKVMNKIMRILKENE